MQTYKVQATTRSAGAKRSHATVTEVVASDREAAVYMAFERLSDKGQTVVKFNDVHMFDADTEVWHLIPSHRQLSAAYK